LGKIKKGSKHLTMRGRFIPAYCFSLLILVLASLPRDELRKIQIYPENPLLKIILSDPFMHFVVYGLLALFICRGLCRESRRSIPLAIVAVVAIGYGFLIELYQGVLPWRAFGSDDLAWNTLGVLFFLGLVEVTTFLTHRPNVGI
jgi:VanZ family protein